MPDDPKAETTALARWMERFRVDCRELGKRSGIAENHIGAYRNGKRRPSDPLKVAIMDATIAIETELGISPPAGVTLDDWFSQTEIDDLRARRVAARS